MRYRHASQNDAQHNDIITSPVVPEPQSEITTGTAQIRETRYGACQLIILLRRF
jgi:hypothetical protein